MPIHDISSGGELSSVLQSTKSVVIVFCALWSGACKEARNEINVGSVRYRDVYFGWVNVDEVPDAADVFFVEEVPTAIGFKDENEVSKWIGPIDDQYRVDVIVQPTL